MEDDRGDAREGIDSIKATFQEAMQKHIDSLPQGEKVNA